MKKFMCVRCKQISKRHDHLGGAGLCNRCDAVVGYEADEAHKMVNNKQPIPDRLMYLFTPKETAALSL